MSALLDLLKNVRNYTVGGMTAIGAGGAVAAGEGKRLEGFISAIESADDELQIMVGKWLGTKDIPEGTRLDASLVARDYFGHPLLYEWKIDPLDLVLLPFGGGAGLLIKSVLLNGGFKIAAHALNKDDVIDEMTDPRLAALVYGSRRLVDKFFDIESKDGKIWLVRKSTSGRSKKTLDALFHALTKGGN